MATGLCDQTRMIVIIVVAETWNGFKSEGISENNRTQSINIILCIIWL